MGSSLTFALDDEQEALARTVRRFVDAPATRERLRAVVERGGGHDAASWATLVSLGLPGLTIAEAAGGAGLGPVELAVVLEALGRGLVASPYFATVALGATALAIAGDETQRLRWLPGIAQGDQTATLAFVDGDRFTLDPPSAGRGVHATDVDGGYRLNGTLGFVLDGATAGLLIVRAGEGLFVVEERAHRGEALVSGLRRIATPTLDLTRPLATLQFTDVFVPSAARLRLEAATALPAILHRAQIALAAEQAGGARRCLEMAVDHAKTRAQFGRPIGSFQAVAHRCADMMVQVETARTASWYAAFQAATLADQTEGLASVAALAAATCGAAYLQCASSSLQVHGGIGFTWEHDVQLHYKRARASASLLGDAAWHADRFAEGLA